MRRTSGMLILAALLASATRAVADPSAPWRRVDARGRFTFRVPPGMSEVPVQGIDSYVGKWSGPGIVLGFDYGWYSNPLEIEGVSDASRRDVTVGGKPARLVAYTWDGDPEGKHRVGIHFPHVADDGTRLTMIVRFSDPALLVTAETILRSIEFP